MENIEAKIPELIAEPVELSHPVYKHYTQEQIRTAIEAVIADQEMSKADRIIVAKKELVKYEREVMSSGKFDRNERRSLVREFKKNLERQIKKLK